MLSPILFSIYTNEMQISNDVLTLVKYADDMALVAQLRDEHSFSQYFCQVEETSKWFKDSFLALNVGKTKEMIFDTRQKNVDSEPMTIDQKQIEIVESFRYLGALLDATLRGMFKY